MELNEYQQRAFDTCMATSDNFSYMMLNMVAEVGEVAGKVGKGIRKGEMVITDNQLMAQTSLKENHELKKEVGDVLWQLSGLCTVMGWSLEDVAQQNLDKLADRKNRQVIDGNGDNR